MILKINDNKTIIDIKMKFAECFPYLKLEVYYKGHKWKEASRSKFLVPHDKRLGDIRRGCFQGIMNIKSWHKTGEVEGNFKDIFGLNVQIFRRYKDSWIQTTNSDGLTLKEQSEIAEKTVGRICVPE
jgi:hypothetical protein